ncbi:hypothetical protein NQ317_014425 [Molorchus minor]|uniref:Uncharacterized protein n=1 Tax=Molorchus minor TaxID=1323400 RepID=A0ABQ9K6W4_9CUCU|nr:hypothetical protein NQ317_014425 [Molorchus minor]
MDREFTTNPGSIEVAEFQPAFLTCNIHSTPSADIQWEFNNQPLPQHTRYVPLPQGALLILNSQTSDAGSYRQVLFIWILRQQKEGTMHTFWDICRPVGYADGAAYIPKRCALFLLSFKKKEYTLEYTSCIFLLLERRNKNIRGKNTCKATNSILNKEKYSKAATLSVFPSLTNARQPIFLPLGVPLNNSVLVGENLSLYCAVSGWPTPKVQWLNNDSVVIGNSTILRILDAKLRHRGNYTCLAYNTEDRISQTFKVEVWQRPYFNVTPVSKIYPAAQTARLDCQANGVPDPRINWLKDGEPLVYRNHIKRLATGLVFSHTFSSDSGIYQCVASNLAGKVWIAGQIEIDGSHSPRPPESLRCRPYDSTTICLSWKPPENVSVQAYSVYSFYRGQARDESGPEYITTDTYKAADSLNSSTNYTFYVRLYSKAASDRSELVTCQTGVKGRRDLDIAPVGTNSVRLNWSEIGTDIPCDEVKTPYKVQWKREGHSTINVERTPEQTHVVTGLSPGTNYEFRISSTSYDKDLGPWTPYTHSKIKSTTFDDHKTNNTNTTEAVPLSPEQVEGIPESPTSIKLTWMDVGNKKFYTICYVLVKEAQKCEDGRLLKSFSNKLLIDKLKSNSTYEFKVRTHNMEGAHGPFSKSIEVQTPADVPSPVQDLMYKPFNDTTACIRWKAPEHKNGKLLRYLISYTPNKNRILEKWINVSIPAHQRKSAACWLGEQETVSTLLGNLTSNIYYTVLVRAVSEVGVGKLTVPIDITTNPQENKEEHVPDLKSEMEYHKKVGVIIGVIMALMCIVCCITCILVRETLLEA